MINEKQTIEQTIPRCATCKHNISCSTMDGHFYNIKCKKHVTTLVSRPFLNLLICAKYKERKAKPIKHSCNCGCCSNDNEQWKEEFFQERLFEKVSYSDKGILPTRNDKGSAGYDFYTPEKLVIKPGEIVKFNTDIKAKLYNQDVLMLFVRSSIGIKKNLMLCNGTGIIDSTYYNNTDNEGNIMCALYNYGNQEVVIEAGDRIVQGIIIPYYVMDNDMCLNETRIGGIGSSGK